MSRVAASRENSESKKQVRSETTHSVYMCVIDGSTYTIRLEHTAAGSDVPTIGQLRTSGKTTTDKLLQSQRLDVCKEFIGENYPIWATNLPPTIHVTELQDLDLISLSKSGLATKEVSALAERLELPVKEMVRLLTLSQRTFHRRNPDERLDQVASERLLLLAQLADHGYDVFDDQGKFNRWLRRPLRILGDQRPLDILDTSQGIRLIDNLLGRIEYGVYS